MNRQIPNELMARLSDYLSLHMALRFPPERYADLHRGISSAAREFGFDSDEECVRWLMRAPLSKHQVEVLASHLTIGETYFFRDPKMFEALERDILPPVVRARRERERYLRIWSAGCATGEEPYSVAIMLSRLLPDMERWNITILGTDINPRFLRRAREGEYGEWSFRSVPAAIKERYFIRAGQRRYRISPALRDCVTFGYVNLAEDLYPSLLNRTNGMDVILCRNVLMYFSQERQIEVVRKFHRALVPRGYLVVSPTEMSTVVFSPFADAKVAAGAIYRKDTDTPAAAPKLTIGPYAPPPAPAASVRAPRPPVPPVPPAAADPLAEAEGLYRLGRYAEAATTLSASLGEDAADIRAVELMARVQANLGHLGAARDWCEKAIARNKLDPVLHFLLATILQEMGLFDEQETALSRVIYLDSDFVLAYFARGNLALLRGAAREAQRHFENALTVLAKMEQDETVPHSEGIPVGRMREMIDAAMKGATAC